MTLVSKNYFIIKLLYLHVPLQYNFLQKLCTTPCKSLRPQSIAISNSAAFLGDIVLLCISYHY